MDLEDLEDLKEAIEELSDEEFFDLLDWMTALVDEDESED